MTNSYPERFAVEADLEWPSRDPGPVPSPPLFDQDNLIADEPVDASLPLLFDQDERSGRILRRLARKRARRRRALITVLAAITVPLGVGAGLSFAQSGGGGGHKGRRVLAERPTRPPIVPAVHLPGIALETAPQAAPVSVPGSAAPGADVRTTSLGLPRLVGGIEPQLPSTAAVVAAAPVPTSGSPAPPPTTAAAPPPSSPSADPDPDPDPVCPLLPVVCQ